jgi:hypothetical protein
MSRDGSGNYSLVSGNPVTTNTVISSTWANSTLSDIAAALTQSLSKDGQTTPTANLTMGNFRLISLAAGTNRTDAVNVGQVQDNTPAVLSSIGGTGDAITGATSPAIVSYATDSKFVYTPTTTNTLSNPTIAIDGLAAKTITQSNGLGLWSGALVVGTPYELLYDGTNFRIQSGTLGGFSITPQGQPFALRNRFIDGNFDFWDMGTTFTLSGGPTAAYTANMWLCNPGSGGGVATISQAIFTPGAPSVGLITPIANALQFAQTTQATGAQPSIQQRIESVAMFEGRSCTLSFWARTTSGTLTIPNLFVVQNFGSGGSAAVQSTPSVALNLTTTLQYFSIRIDIPSISGKTVGAGNFLAIGILFPLSTTFTIQTLQWQVEDCPAGAPASGLPTPFEMRGLALEASLTERYVHVLINAVSSSGDPLSLAAATSTTAATMAVPIPRMRSTPSMSFLGGSVANLAAFGLVPTAISLISVSSNGPKNVARIDLAFSSGLTSGQASLLRNNSGNTILLLDCRF